MSDFKAKMHQIRFRLGLRLRPRWGAHSVPSDPLADFKGVLLLREGRGMKKNRGKEGREERAKKDGKGERRRKGEGKGKGRKRDRNGIGLGPREALIQSWMTV